MRFHKGLTSQDHAISEVANPAPQTFGQGEFAVLQLNNGLSGGQVKGRLLGHALYQRLANEFPPNLLLGEWFFADAVFGDAIPHQDDYVLKIISRFYSPHEAWVAELLRARALREQFLKGCADRILRLQPKVVGFTTTFHQTCACLALAQRLKAVPDAPVIVFGGANCEGEMGLQLISSFTWIDYVCSGESDNSFPPEVEFPVEHDLADFIQLHYQRFGVEVRVFNVSTDLPVYVMMGVALDTTGRGPAAVVGLGCHLDPSVALVKSLLEICQVRPGEMRRYLKEPPSERLKRYEDVRTLEDHSAFLSIPERLGEFDFLLGNGWKQKMAELPNLSEGSVPADLNRCLSALSERGHRVVYADLTTPDLIDYGLRVARVLATGLQPMHFGNGEERLGGRRLFEVPQRMGLVVGPRSEGDLNPCPHPLA